MASRILMIDDDQDFKKSVMTLLRSEGYEVFEAGSGKSGLQRITEVEPDLIILDIMMENPDAGYGVSHAIKYVPSYEKYRSIPIIMLSSIQSSPDERFKMADGVADMIRPDYYATKPIDIPKFLEMVKKALASG